MKTARSEKGFSPIIILVVIFVLIAVGSVLFISNKNSSKESVVNNQPQVSQKQATTNTSLAYKDVNEYFPKTINSFPIDTSSKGIKVTALNVKALGYPGRPESKDDAVTKNVYRATYAPGKTDERLIDITYYKFVVKDEIEKVRKINQDLMQTLSEGFKQASLSTTTGEYVAAYREVPSSKAADLMAGEARILFPDALVMVKIKVGGAFTLQEFQNIVKGYEDAITSNGTEYVSASEVSN